MLKLFQEIDDDYNLKIKNYWIKLMEKLLFKKFKETINFINQIPIFYKGSFDIYKFWSENLKSIIKILRNSKQYPNAKSNLKKGNVKNSKNLSKYSFNRSLIQNYKSKYSNEMKAMELI